MSTSPSFSHSLPRLLPTIFDICHGECDTDVQDPQLKERFATSVTWYTKGGADGFLPLLTPNRPPGAAGGANTPRPPPGTRPGTPQQAATAGAASSSTNTSAPAAAAGAAAVPPARPSSSSDFKEEAEGPAASAPKATVKTEPVDQSNAPSTAPAAAADKSGEAQVTKAESSTTANGSAARPPVPTAPAAPPPPPAPPVPVEPEEVRRKRKLEALLAEVAPGAQFELGVTEVSVSRGVGSRQTLIAGIQRGAQLFC